jgi:hypothetical protein
MLDHQATRGLRQGAHAARALIVALLVAAPASAQLPILDPPAEPPPAPRAASVTLGGDAAHRHAWTGTGLRPPLATLWSVAADPVTAPVVAGRTVVVETSQALTAYAGATGAQAWSVPLSSPVELAADDARVYAAGSGGLAALDAATGTVVWATSTPAIAPVVAEGRVIVGTADGVAAFDAGSGAGLWTGLTGIAGGRPAVAGGRVYVAGACRARALSASNGLSVWSTGDCPDVGRQTMLAGGAVISEGAGIYAAEDGELLLPGPGPGTVGEGLAFATPLGTAPSELVARDAVTLARRWTWTPKPAARMLFRPAAVDGRIWQVAVSADDGMTLTALDAATGRRQWTGFLPGAGLVAPGTATAVAAVAGGLLVPTAGGRLTVLRNAAGGHLGVRGQLPANVVAAGSDTLISGELVEVGESGLAGPRRVVLQADRWPFGGRWRRVGRQRAGRDGFSFVAGVERNTRFRVRADGAASRATAVYALPRLLVDYERTGSRRVVTATVRVVPTRGLRTSGARAALYRLRSGSRTATRLGSGTVASSGAAVFPIRIPGDLKRSDSLLSCLRGTSRQGFGYPDVLDRHCGDARIRIPQGSTSASPSRLPSTSRNHAARSPLPLLG